MKKIILVIIRGSFLKGDVKRITLFSAVWAWENKSTRLPSNKKRIFYLCDVLYPPEKVLLKSYKIVPFGLSFTSDEYIKSKIEDSSQNPLNRDRRHYE